MYVKYLEQSNAREIKQIKSYQGLGEGSGKLLLNGNIISVWGDEKILETDSGDGYTTE